MTAVVGTGPVGFTTDKGIYYPIPLSALSYANGAVSVNANLWPPASDGGTKTAAEAFATYLYNQELLSADTTGAKVAAGPAFIATATHGGLLSDQITITISGVVAKIPADMTTVVMEVSLTNVYAGLTTASAAATLGNSSGKGSKPGLVYADPASSLAAVPATTAAPVSLASGKADFVDGGGNTVLTLRCDPDPDPALTFTAEIVTTGSSFDLTVKWDLTKPADLLKNHATSFATVVAITPPPNDYGVPVAGPYHLGGGADTTQVPPVPATATVPSA